MKIVEDFSVVIENVKYISFENKSAFTKEEKPTIYLCSANVSEVGRGMSRFKQYHNVQFYLTEEQWNVLDEAGKHVFLEKGDKVNILAGAKWVSQNLDYKSYNKEVIEKADKSQLKVDKDGKTYWNTKCYAYHVQCKDEKAFALENKWYDRVVCTILNSKIKLPLESKEQFKQAKLDYFLDPPEMDVIEQYEDQIVKVVAYSDGNKFGEKMVHVSTTRDLDAGTYYLVLDEVTDASNN